MTYYAGVDVSLRSVNICVVDNDGELVVETKLSSDVQEIIAYLDELEYSIDIVGLEAGTLAQYLTYGLQSAGFNVVCMEAQQVKAALSAMRNKTDKHDARGIAQLLRSGWYSSVHIKSMESHHIRMLLTSRRAVLDKCIDLENEIRGLFKVFGIKLPKRLGHGSFDKIVRAVIEADEKLSHALRRPYLQSRGCRRSIDSLCRSQLNAHKPQVVTAQCLGNEGGKGARSQESSDRRGQKTRRHPPPHVDR
jgi:transposase